jgi:sugar lactone lactonase YvrE
MSTSQSASPTPLPSPTPVATYVLEINPVATLAGEVTLNGKKLYYITTPVYDPLTLTGMAADEQYIWLINNETNSIFALDPKTGETSSAFPFPETMGQDPNILGLAWDGENFWLAEVNDKTIYQYDSTFKVQLNSFSITNHPGSIAWDGQSIWVTIREMPEIQNWSTKGELLKTYTVPGQELTGLAWGADRLWYVDAIEKVVRYWVPTSASAEVIITDALASQSFGSLSWQGNSLLLLDDMGGRLLSFDIDEFNFIK